MQNLDKLTVYFAKKKHHMIAEKNEKVFFFTLTELSLFKCKFHVPIMILNFQTQNVLLSLKIKNKESLL